MKMGEGRAVETSARASSKALVSEIARSDARDGRRGNARTSRKPSKNVSVMRV